MPLEDLTSIEEPIAYLLEELARGPALYSILDAAALFGVSSRTIERRIASGELVAVYVSPRRRRLTRHALVDFVARLSTIALAVLFVASAIRRPRRRTRGRARDTTADLGSTRLDSNAPRRADRSAG